MSPEKEEKKTERSEANSGKASMVENAKIISGLFLEKDNIRIKQAVTSIIHGIPPQEKATRKVQVIGGDTDMTEADTPPSIILEKEGDNISRIIVKCPCGRHSELVCEYDNDTEQEN
jgi:hypothetical protein